MFFWLAVLLFSYFTAFMETLTISSFPYYSVQSPSVPLSVSSPSLLSSPLPFLSVGLAPVACE